MMKTIVLKVLFGGVLIAGVAGGLKLYRRIMYPGDSVETVESGGQQREYRVHVPVRSGTAFDMSRRLPVIFAFHGSSASASVIERETSLDQRADSFGFVVVYPEGLHRGWNIGECCRYSFKHHVDETAFVNAMIDQLKTRLKIDTTRMYATGYSDGGTLSYLLACAIPNRMAAVAGISGTLFEPEPSCPLPHPVSVMVVHGSGDSHIPYAGHPGGPPTSVHGMHFNHSASDVTAFWQQRNQCHTPAEVQQHGKVIRARYACADSSEVLFYTIVGGEHGWPGGGRGWVFSPEPPKDMIATDSVVRFFLRHHVPN